MISTKFTLLPLAVASLSLFSCITVAPVHGSYEKAGTLGKGNVELSGNYSRYVVGGDGESEALNNNVGIRAGFGLSNKVDLKVRYEKLMVVHKEDDADFNANYYSVIPKFNFIPGKLSLFVPVSMYQFKTTTSDGVYKSSSYSIAPHLIRTFTNKSNTVDFSPSVNLEFLMSTQDGETENHLLAGYNIGAGFSSDLSKWAIRPEIGYLFEPAESGHVWNFGVGLQFTIPSKKKSN
jgi:hypothetical protein